MRVQIPCKCECVCVRACARTRRERRRNMTTQPLDVIHHVRMYMCECMYVHMDARADSMQVCVRVRVRAGARARRERHTRAPTRRVSLRAYICVRMSTCTCMSVRVDSMGACACAHLRVRACAARMGYSHLYNVRLYRRLCNQACMLDVHTRIGGSVYVGLQPIPSCMRVRMHICMRVSMARYRLACLANHA
jgi:hypothetical protein